MSKSWLHAAPPKNQTLCMTELSKHFLNTRRLSAVTWGPWSSAQPPLSFLKTHPEPPLIQLHTVSSGPTTGHQSEEISASLKNVSSIPARPSTSTKFLGYLSLPQICNHVPLLSHLIISLSIPVHKAPPQLNTVDELLLGKCSCSSTLQPG